jgi:hypothetical protein
MRLCSPFCSARLGALGQRHRGLTDRRAGGPPISACPFLYPLAALETRPRRSPRPVTPLSAGLPRQGGGADRIRRKAWPSTMTVHRQRHGRLSARPAALVSRRWQERSNPGSGRPVAAGSRGRTGRPPQPRPPPTLPLALGSSPTAPQPPQRLSTPVVHVVASFVPHAGARVARRSPRSRARPARQPLVASGPPRTGCPTRFCRRAGPSAASVMRLAHQSSMTDERRPHPRRTAWTSTLLRPMPSVLMRAFRFSKDSSS